MTDDRPGSQRRLESIEALTELVVASAEGHQRFVVGLVGPPGAGKSTVSMALARLLPAMPPIVAMDGFHLANDVLIDRGSIDRKGAPDTFDAHGFVTLLERLRSADTTVWCPRFDRSLEDSISAAVGVHPADRIVVVEGNYLLLDTDPWVRVAELVDLSVYLDLDQATRVGRLVARHVEFAKTAVEARRFVESCDEANAALVEASRSRAGAILTIS